VWRAKPKRKWTLRPRTPDDCLDCRLAHTEHGPSRAQGPRPWCEVKSKRGRPKQHDSHGQACMDTRCEYYKVTDAAIHALRWDGQRNACEATDQWECGACGSKHTARLGTPMYRLKTASAQVKVGRKLKQVYTKVLWGERSAMTAALQAIGLSGNRVCRTA
jgi:hypothetical protein